MNFTSTPPHFSSSLNLTDVPKFTGETTAGVSFRNSNQGPGNRKSRREQAQIDAKDWKEEHTKPARYLTAAKKREIQGRRAQKYVANLKNAAEQESCILEKASPIVDEGPFSGTIFDLVGKSVAKSLSSLTSYAVTHNFNLASDSKEVKPLDDNTKELTRYADAVSLLRRSGVKKIFLAEHHWDPENVNLIAGALSGGNGPKNKGVVFYREMDTRKSTRIGTPDEDKEWDEILASPQYLKSSEARRLLLQQLLKNIVKKPDEVTGPGVDMLRNEITESAGVEIKLASFLNPERMDIDNILKQEKFLLASVGLAHAMYKFNTRNDLLLPWTGFITENPFPTYLYSDEVLKDMFNGFERAAEKCRAALILQSNAWNDDMTKEDVHRYYNGEGFVVVELPLSKSVNATIVAPASALPKFQLFAEEHDGHVWILCNGIKGCDTPGTDEIERHDEF